jgi:MFS family permease
MEYQVILTYGYANHYLSEGLFATLKEAENAASIGAVTDALFFFTIGSAVAQVLMGFICDGKGRKAAAIFMASLCTASLAIFFAGASLGWPAWIVGLFCGSCIGSYYSTNDVIIMMIGESSPTNLRSSTISAQAVVMGMGVIFCYLVGIPLVTTLGNGFAGIISLCMAAPGFVIALIMLCKKTHDTTGINMDTVTGCEWD